MFSNDDIIFAYTRKMAIDDGVLIDATEAAQLCGFKVPMAITIAAWVRCVTGNGRNVSADVAHRRLLLLLSDTWKACRNANGNRVRFTYRPAFKNESVTLILHIGPGDTAAPVCTLMEPDDD